MVVPGGGKTMKFDSQSSGAVMERATRGSRTRNEILAAGVRLFALRGYSKTSTSDILEAVGLSKGAFYYHFKSKDALAAAVLREAEGDYHRELAGAVAQIEAGGRVAAALERLVALIRQAAKRPKSRKKTRPSRASQQRRLESKRHRAKIKETRRFDIRSEE